MASAPRIELVGGKTEFAPGETLAVEINGGPANVAVEFSICWYTTGKGDSNLGAAYFEEITDKARPIRRQVKLPAGPLSYDGRLIKIHWEARARWQTETTTDKQPSVAAPFRLGKVHQPIVLES